MRVDWGRKLRVANLPVKLISQRFIEPIVRFLCGFSVGDWYPLARFSLRVSLAKPLVQKPSPADPPGHKPFFFGFKVSALLNSAHRSLSISTCRTPGLFPFSL